MDRDTGRQALTRSGNIRGRDAETLADPAEDAGLLVCVMAVERRVRLFDGAVSAFCNLFEDKVEMVAFYAAGAHSICSRHCRRSRWRHQYAFANGAARVCVTRSEIADDYRLKTFSSAQTSTSAIIRRSSLCYGWHKSCKYATSTECEQSQSQRHLVLNGLDHVKGRTRSPMETARQRLLERHLTS